MGMKKRKKEGELVFTRGIKFAVVRESEDGTAELVCGYVDSKYNEQRAPCDKDTYKWLQGKASRKNMEPLSRMSKQEFFVEVLNNELKAVHIVPELKGNFKTLAKQEGYRDFKITVEPVTGSVWVQEAPDTTTNAELRTLVESLADLEEIEPGTVLGDNFATITSVVASEITVQTR